MGILTIFQTQVSGFDGLQTQVPGFDYVSPAGGWYSTVVVICQRQTHTSWTTSYVEAGS